MKALLCATTMAVLLAACAHAPVGATDDVEILTAVLTDPFLREMLGEEKAYLVPVTHVDFVHPWMLDPPKETTYFQGPSQQAIEIPPQWFAELRRRNRHHAGLHTIELDDEHFTRRADAKTRRVEVSLPAISSDQRHALAAVRFFTPHGTCPSGYTVALVKTSSGWVVQGRGSFWIV